MKITKSKIKKLYKFYDELEEIERDATNKYTNAKENQSAVAKIEKNGEQIETTEKHLWDEVFYLGELSPSGQYLKGKYPQAFEAFTEQNKKAEELKDWCIKEFGIDYNKIKLSDIIKVVEAVVDYKINEKS